MIYVFIFLIFFVCIFTLNSNKKKTNLLFYIILCFILIFIVAFRYKIGNDSQIYEDEFKKYPDIFNLHISTFSYSNYQPLWIILNSIIRTISPNFVFFQIFQSIFVNTVIFSFLYKYSKKPFISLFLYFSLYFYFFNCETLRESLSVAVFLLSFKYLERKKYFVYYIYCIVGLLFHIEAIILFFIPLIPRVKINKRLIIWLIIIALIFFFSFNFILKYLDISNFSDIIQYKFHVYSYNASNGLTPYSIVVNGFFPVIVLILTIKRKKRNIQFDKYVFLYVLFLFLSISFGILSRLASYFIVFYIIYITDFISSVNVKIRHPFIRGLNAIILTAFFSIQFISWFYIKKPSSNFKNYDMIMPYHSVFDEKKNSTYYY